MIIRLALFSALEVLALAGALIYFLYRIASALEQIGGTAESSLAKIGWGVRAIERETAHIAPQVTQLNQSLTALAQRLNTVDQHLKSAAQALSDGKGGTS
ncbi:MAG: hypothetical protein M5U01_36000 [Ardenticatenaceae bacterium]|nr:hypothetical protein [Ardenticatenaceae bacterium]HBY97561.1 hypothetical protein [Chloroflexota bacterium]